METLAFAPIIVNDRAAAPIEIGQTQLRIIEPELEEIPGRYARSVRRTKARTITVVIIHDVGEALLEVIGGAIHSIGQTEDKHRRVRLGVVTNIIGGPRQRSVTTVDTVAGALLHDSHRRALVQAGSTEINNIITLVGVITVVPKLSSRRSDNSTCPRHQLILLGGIENQRSLKVGSYI